MPSQLRANMRQQHPGADGFAQIVIGANLEAGHLVDIIVQSRQHDDGIVKLRANITADAQAVIPRKHQIQHQQIRHTAPDVFRGIFPRILHFDHKAVPAQKTADELCQLLVVVDNQNLVVCHALNPNISPGRRAVFPATVFHEDGHSTKCYRASLNLPPDPFPDETPLPRKAGQRQVDRLLFIMSWKNSGKILTWRSPRRQNAWAFPARTQPPAIPAAGSFHHFPEALPSAAFWPGPGAPSPGHLEAAIS